jgi:hypothetical protein
MSTDGTTYNELVDIRTMGEPGNADAPDVDVTPLAPTGDYREFKSGLLVAGDFTFEQFYTADRFSTLYARLRLTTYWRLTFPDLTTPSKLEFQGTLKKCNIGAMGNPDDPLVVSCSIKISGEPTFTAGS